LRAACREPPEPIVTGNAAADAVDVTLHDLEPYDALFERTKVTADGEGPAIDDDDDEHVERG
jgi:hypothetical protein